MCLKLFYPQLHALSTSNNVEATFDFVEKTFEFVAKTATTSKEFIVEFRTFDEVDKN